MVAGPSDCKGFFRTTSTTLAVLCRCVMFRTSTRLRPSGCNSRKWESKRVLTHHQMSLPPCLPPLLLRRRPAASAASRHRSFRAAMRPPRKGPARAAGHPPRSPGGCRPPAFPATWWVTKWCMVKWMHINWQKKTNLYTHTHIFVYVYLYTYYLHLFSMWLYQVLG